jgi:hypothetical protein
VTERRQTRSIGRNNVRRVAAILSSVEVALEPRPAISAGDATAYFGAGARTATPATTQRRADTRALVVIVHLSVAAESAKSPPGPGTDLTVASFGTLGTRNAGKVRGADNQTLQRSVRASHTPRCSAGGTGFDPRGKGAFMAASAGPASKPRRLTTALPRSNGSLAGRITPARNLPSASAGSS